MCSGSPAGVAGWTSAAPKHQLCLPSWELLLGRPSHPHKGRSQPFPRWPHPGHLPSEASCTKLVAGVVTLAFGMCPCPCPACLPAQTIAANTDTGRSVAGQGPVPQRHAVRICSWALDLPHALAQQGVPRASLLRGPGPETVEWPETVRKAAFRPLQTC